MLPRMKKQVQRFLKIDNTTPDSHRLFTSSTCLCLYPCQNHSTLLEWVEASEEWIWLAERLSGRTRTVVILIIQCNFRAKNSQSRNISSCSVCRVGNVSCFKLIIVHVVDVLVIYVAFITETNRRCLLRPYIPLSSKRMFSGFRSLEDQAQNLMYACGTAEMWLHVSSVWKYTDLYNIDFWWRWIKPQQTSAA